MELKLDSKDFEIIECLKKDASLSIREISKKTSIPITTVHHRIKSLKEKGVIEKITIKLNQEKIGLGLGAYILINILHHLPSGEKITQQEICARIAKLPLVESVDAITGEMDVLVRARAKDLKQLSEEVITKIREIPGVERTNTLTVLYEMKKE